MLKNVLPKRALIAALVAALAGCGLPDPRKAPVVAQPSNAPTRNLTSFSEALRCMDQLFVAHGKTGFIITSTALPDATGKMSVGVRDMLITAVSRMSQHSQAFRYVDFETKLTEADTVQHLSQLLLNSGQMQLEAPQIYIRGSISQVDPGVQTGKEGIGITSPYFSMGAQRDRQVSLVTLELHLGDFLRRSLIPGIAANNTIAIVRDGQGMDAGATISKAGISFSVASDTTESGGQAVRTLVELGVIELLGKWTQVPYWTCLEIERTNPMVIKQLRDWYDAMSEKDRVELIQAGLKGAGYYHGAVDARFGGSEDLRSALSRFQADRGIVPTGRVSFEAYETLMSSDPKLLAAARPAVASTPAAVPSKPQQVVARPIAVTMTSDKNPNSYSVGETMTIRLSLSRSGFPYCYYQDANGSIVQIYPNRFQSEKLVSAGRSLTIPDPAVSGNFVIRLPRAGAGEKFLCLATDTDIGPMLPPPLRVKDLSPIGVRTLDEVLQMIRGVTQSGTLGNARLNVAVK